MNIRSSDASLHNMSQPDCSIPGSSIVYGANNIYLPKFNDVFCKCRSAEIKSTGADGILEIHLVGDPAAQWYLMELVAGQEKGRYFDAIRSTGTTAVLANVTLFPAV